MGTEESMETSSSYKRKTNKQNRFVSWVHQDEDAVENHHQGYRQVKRNCNDTTNLEDVRTR